MSIAPAASPQTEATQDAYWSSWVAEARAMRPDHDKEKP